MPKSSIASFTPMTFNSMRSEWIRSSRRSRTLSVSSSISADGGRPEEARTRRTPSTKPGSRNWRADTLTLTYSGGWPTHWTMSAAASPSTQEPSGTM